MIMRAANKLKPLHAAGSIHGDLKPQNILLSQSEPVLIDSLNLEEDEIPPALSPDWAAPEQLLMQSVSKATDIYPLGLMLCGLVGGQLTGEYVQYLLPSPYREELIVPLVRNPLIYVDPQDKELILASRKPWFDFIENCLSFEKSSRPKDANEFVSELNSLCNKYPLEGSVQIDIGPPLLPELAVLNDGSERPFRVLMDKWTSLRRPPVVE
jgi:serine/threonine protein kinase